MIVATAILCILLATWIIPSERQRQESWNLVEQRIDHSFKPETRDFLLREPLYENADSFMISGRQMYHISDSHPWYEYYCKDVAFIECHSRLQIDWASFPHLKRLRFNYNDLTRSDKKATEELLLKLASANRELESLELYHWTINQKALNSLSSLTQLEELNLDFVDLDGLNLDLLVSLESLKVVSLFRTDVSNDELKKLLQLPRLEILGVTVEGSSREKLDLIKQFSNLKTVHIDRINPSFLRFQLSGDQFRQLMSDKSAIKDGEELLSILAGTAKQNHENALERAAVEWQKLRPIPSIAPSIE